MQLPTWVMSTITRVMPAAQLPASVRDKCFHLVLADPKFDTPAPVKLLLGVDIFPQVLCSKRQALGHRFPTAFETIFSWILLLIIKVFHHHYTH